MNQLPENKNRVIKLCGLIIFYSILVIVFSTPVWFDIFKSNYNTFELNKLIIVRSLTSIALLAYFLKIILQGEMETYKNKKIFLLWLLLFCVYLIGVIFSVHPQLSFIGNYARHQGFYSTVFYLLFFLLLILELKNFGQIKKIILATILSSIPVVIYGMVQYFGADPLKWNEPGGRIFSSLGQPNFLGYYLILVLPLTIYFLIFIAKKYYQKILLLIVFCGQWYCLIKTGSRGAGFGILGGLVLLILFSLWVKNHKKICLGIVGILILSGILIGINAQSFSEVRTNIGYVDRMITSFNVRGVGQTTGIRLKYWNAAWSDFKQTSVRHKLFGYGIDTQEDVFIRYYEPSWGVQEKMNSYPDRAHNLVLDILIQFGLIGLIIIWLFNGYIVLKGINYLKVNINQRDSKYWLIGFLIIAVIMYFISNLFSFPLTAHYVYLYLFLAIIWVLSSRSERHNFNLTMFSVSFRYAMFVFVFLFSAFTFYYLTLRELIADTHYMDVRMAEQKYDCRTMLDGVKKSVIAFPLGNYYRNQFLHVNVNCYDAVTSKDDKVILVSNVINQIELIDKKEYQYYTWLNIAHDYSVFCELFGDRFCNLAEDNYKILIKINPYITVNYQDYGRMEMWRKNYDKAIEIFKTGISVAPPLDIPGFDDSNTRVIEKQIIYLNELIATAYFNKEDYDNSILYYQRALDLKPDYARIYKSIADAYYKIGNLDKSIEYTLAGFKQEPDDGSWLISLSLLYKEEGNQEAMLKYAKQAVELEPQNQDFRKFLNEISQ